MTGAKLPAPPAAIALLLLLGAVSLGASAASVAGAAAAQEDTLVATVRYVHEDTGGVDVIVGVQLALRLEYYRVTESTRIERGGESIALGDLQPGELVRITYHEDAEARVADAIEVVAPPMREGER